MSYVWGNIVGETVFVNLWTMILTGVSGAKKEKSGNTSLPTSISVSSKGSILIYN